MQSKYILSKTVLSSETKHCIEKRWVRVWAIWQKKLQQSGVCDRRVRALFYLTIGLDINQSWPEQWYLHSKLWKPKERFLYLHLEKSTSKRTICHSLPKASVSLSTVDIHRHNQHAIILYLAVWIFSQGRVGCVCRHIMHACTQSHPKILFLTQSQ